MSCGVRAIADDEGWWYLLAALDADPHEAGRRYERLRARLIEIFRWKGLAGAEELADDAFDRAARRLAAGEQLERGIAAYLTGIARKLVLARTRHDARIGRERARHDARIGELPDDPAARAPDRRVVRAEVCLEGCLGEQPVGARDLLLRYLAGQGASKISARKAIASELGINTNTLRIRVHRIRVVVKTCIQKCVAASDSARNIPPTLSPYKRPRSPSAGAGCCCAPSWPNR